jgi:hypothetical protein
MVGIMVKTMERASLIIAALLKQACGEASRVDPN